MLSFSAQPSNAHKIYISMRSAQGNDDGAFREFGYQGAKLYATAMLLGRIAEMYKRILEQHSPKTVTYLLADKELEYGIVPDTSRTDLERRVRLISRYLSGIGASETDLVSGLAILLGSGFIDLVPPSDPVFADLIDNFSTTPPTYVNYTDSTKAGKWMLADHDWGANSGFLRAVLICGEPPIVGDIFVFGSHNETITQKCVVTHVEVITTGEHLGKYLLDFSGVVKPVEANQGFTTSAYPIWSTGRRRFLIGISDDVRLNADTVADMNAYMERSARAVDVWDKSAPQAAGFRIDGIGATQPGLLGFTLIQ